MSIDEYTEHIIHNLEIASNCEIVEKIIHRSIQKLQEKHIHSYKVVHYLVKLKDSLEILSPDNFDSIHWCNIKCAILYLKKLTSKEFL
jgi:hypothetical protein